MKAQLLKLSQTVQRQLTVLKVGGSRLKQRLSAWLARHRRSLWLAAIGMTVLVIIATGALGWQRSPALRAAGKAVGVSLAGLLAWLKIRPTVAPAAVVASEQPRREAGLPVFPDGREF